MKYNALSPSFYILILTSVLSGLVLAGCSASPTSSPASSSIGSLSKPVARRELIDYALENTLTLRAHDSSGEEISLGSGFFIDGGHVVTNAHVIAGAAWVEMIDLSGQVVASAPYALAVDIENDLAILPTPHSEREGLSLSVLDAQVADDIWVFGAPLGLEGTTSSGVVSAFRDKDGLELMQITAPISQGSSGGPVLNSSGEVIGVATLIMTGGQNLNFAVPVSKLLDLRFSAGNRESFPSASAFEDEFDIEVFIMLATMATSPVLELDSTTRGRLDADSPTLEGSPYSVYQIEGNAGQRLRIDVMSNQIDTVAWLVQDSSLFSDDLWSVEDDDGGAGTDSRIETTLPDTDVYYLFVTSYVGRLGSYNVVARETSSRQTRLKDGRWLYAATGDDNERFYIDTETISHTRSNVTVWVLQDLGSPEQLPSGQRIDSTRVLYEFNCRSRQVRMKAYSFRLQDNLVSSADIPAYEQSWRSIEPATVAEMLYSSVCNQ